MQQPNNYLFHQRESAGQRRQPPPYPGPSRQFYNGGKFSCKICRNGIPMWWLVRCCQSNFEKTVLYFWSFLGGKGKKWSFTWDLLHISLQYYASVSIFVKKFLGLREEGMKKIDCKGQNIQPYPSEKTLIMLLSHGPRVTELYFFSTDCIEINFDCI